MSFRQAAPATGSVLAHSANFIVVTPHWGAHSLKFDLTADEIPVTGGRRRFARVLNLRPGSLERIHCSFRTTRSLHFRLRKESHAHRGRRRLAHRARHGHTGLTFPSLSATSVGAAGIAGASTRCLLRLTRSGRFLLRRIVHRTTAFFAPPGEHKDQIERSGLCVILK